MGARDPQFLSEQARNARKYEKLVRALRKTHELSQEVEQSTSFSIADILIRLLPHYVTAFEAQRGFVARRARKKTRGRQFDVIAVEPTSDATHKVFLSARIEKLIDNGGARILTPRDLTGVIPELRGFEAQSAVLASFRALEHVYLVGLLDKADADKYPFLAGDRRVLESLLSLLALGVRSVERRQRDLHIIQEISEKIVAGENGGEEGTDVWLMIARSAAAVSGARFVGVYALNHAYNLLEARCAWDNDRQVLVGSGAPLPLTGASLNVEVARTKRSLYLPNVGAYPAHFLMTAAETEVRSAYCAPLVSRGELVGTLYVASTSFDGINVEQRESIDRLAPHVAIALHNAQLLAQQSQTHDIDVDVIKIQHAIADVLDEETQDRQLHDVLRQFFPTSCDFFVASYDAHTTVIRPRLTYERGELVDYAGENLHHFSYRAPDRRTLLSYMLEHGYSLLDIPDTARWRDRSAAEEDIDRGVQCCLIRSLEYAGHLIGWIGYVDFTRTSSFTLRHRILLDTIAPLIATVAHNAKLYGQRISELEAVSKFQTAITELSESEKEEIENVATEVRKTLRELGLYTADFYIALYDEQRNVLRVPVSYEDDRLLTLSERDAHPAYCTRPIEQRNGLVEWILRNKQPVLARTRSEIEQWRSRGVFDVPEEACCWLGVPMLIRNKPVGVVALRSFREESIFTETHIPPLSTIANQAAITIENARLFQHQRKQQNALLHTSQAIARAGGDDPGSVLNTILEQAVRVTDSHLGMLYLKEGKVMKLHAVCPPREQERIRQRFETVPVSRPGVMTLAVREKRAVLETNVIEAQEYLDVSEGTTRSELAVVLFRGGVRTGDVIGVLNVEHKEVGGLNNYHRSLLISLAQLAVSAIQNAEKAAERRRLHTIAVMGVFGADVIHDVKQEVSTIRWAVDRLRNHPDFPVALLDNLNEIDAAAARVRVPDFSTTERSLHAEDSQINRTPLDAVIADEVALFGQRMKTDRKINIDIEMELNCGATRVQIHEDWLRRLLRHYLNNAQKHLAPNRKPRIVVRTVNDAQMVTVFVEDNGRGVRENIRAQLFSWEIAHGNSPPGRGLLLVRLIAEVHGGRAWFVHSEPDKGACFAFSLPVASDPEYSLSIA